MKFLKKELRRGIVATVVAFGILLAMATSVRAHDTALIGRVAGDGCPR